MLYNERGERHGQALDIAKKMMVAARTAPKGKGIDAIEVAVVDGPQIAELATEMRLIGEERGHGFFLRDASCIESAECVLLVGPADMPLGLNCGDCGIALGSACSKAADYRVDTRVLFSAGLAAQRLGFLGACRQVYALPVGISSKSPFFDR